ncbi:hypothetical protein HYPBUDRAFT_3587 [Hyphopichia burtonii NRRL Y-1933]|uniref:C2H2-type domain-containing protein n=1 Tax=Hyphopichia burtonii NRRL Y-1933 TaxID=984485 RepID=A0A1E4RQR9_9ASCO|nr:hypothetical protein HYPBUDRAFT_3587 [Hyphopichia burtonii NRRL Y-1933]ODV69634.1 hypothetical protein HYPBUDRAFT_3587 [Hyphopichia burtonii NRRL Y-1933]
MFYSHTPTYNNIKHPQPQPTKLPSFNELLTSIPLPNDFYPQQQQQQQQQYHKSLSSTPPTSTTSISNYYPTPQSSTSSASSNHFQPQPIHYIPLQIQPIPQYYPQKNTSNVSVSPKTVLDQSFEIPTPPPSSTDYSIRSFTPETPTTNKDKVTKRKHICKTCTRSFTTSGHLARHNRIHTGERKHICPWPTCDARFARQDNCMQHYKTHTNGKNKRSKLNFKNSNLLSK